MTQKEHNESFSKEELHTFVKELKENISQEILGQETLINEILACLLASGHLLMTGAPGLAKTTIVKTLSQYLGLEFGRIQFTPDLLPTDITGSDILNIGREGKEKVFTFQKGPIFANLVLADEINRASPRTQSALLEAMQENKVTFGGKSHDLPSPFLVFATQNPYESEGIFPLPEAQLDRFLLHSVITYPEKEKELEVLERHAKQKLPDQMKNEKKKALSSFHIKELARESQKTKIDKKLIEVIYDFVEATRNKISEEKGLIYGAGTRAGMSLISGAKSLAFMDGSESVSWKHIESLLKPCLRHRIKLSAHAHYDGITEDDFIDDLLVSLKDKYKHLAEGL